MKPSGLLISLSGIDGAGKSTLALWIQERLAQDHGLDSHYIWCKFGDHPFSQYRLTKHIRKIKSQKPRSTRQQSRPRLTYSQKAYGRVMLALHLAQIAITVKGLLKNKRNVICDRYIFDTIVDLQQELHYSMAQAQSVLEANWIPKPDSKFLLDLSEQVAFARKPDSTSIQYLKERRALYISVADQYNLNIVDGNYPIEVVGRTIMQRIIEENLKESVCK